MKNLNINVIEIAWKWGNIFDLFVFVRGMNCKMTCFRIDCFFVFLQSFNLNFK